MPAARRGVQGSYEPPHVPNGANGTNGGFQAVLQALSALSAQVEELRRRTDERFDGLADLYVPRQEMESMKAASTTMVRLYEEKMNAMAPRTEFLQVNAEQDRRLDKIESRLDEMPATGRSQTTLWLMAAGIGVSMLCGAGSMMAQLAQVIATHLH